MKVITLLLLFLLGIVLLIVEFLLIPGISIAGVGCLIAFGVCVFLAFKFFGTMVGIFTLSAILIFVPLFLYLIFKGKAVRPMMLDTDIDGIVKNVEDNLIKPGDEGETIGRLAPAGKAKINGVTLEVRTTGTFVDPQTRIKVIQIDGNNVIIEPIKE